MKGAAQEPTVTQSRKMSPATELKKRLSKEGGHCIWKAEKCGDKGQRLAELVLA